MTTSIVFSLALIVSSSLEDGDIFAGIDRLPVSTAVTQLDALEDLPPIAFQPLGASVLDVAKSARAQAVRIRAVQVVCAKADSVLANTLSTELGTIVQNYRNPSRNKIRDSIFLRAAIGRGIDTWSEPLRQSQSFRAALLTLATGNTGPEAASNAAVDRLVELADTDDEKRAILFAIVESSGFGAWDATWKLIPLLNEATITQVRSLLSESNNSLAVIILGEIGDTASIQIGQQKLAAMAAEGVTSGTPVSDLMKMIWKIEAQTPPENLLTLIQTSQPTSDTIWLPSDTIWLMRRASKLGVDPAQLKNAVVNWAPSASPSIRASLVKQAAIDAGVLTEADLPNVPLLNLPPVADHTHYPAPTEIAVTNRRPKQPHWQPNEANNEQLDNWLGTIDWAKLPNEEALQILLRKLCELDLLHPELCAQVHPPD